jgi:predicted transposase YbfD/YdcC
VTFTEIFNDVPDPRDFTSQHKLIDILFVVFAAMLCGAVHCTEMSLFAAARLELLRRFVPLEHGAPSHDTISRVLRALDPAAFNAAFVRFMTTFGEALEEEGSIRHVAVDGKALRRAVEKASAHMPPMMVTVFASSTFMSLAQTVAGAGGEAEAAVAALKLISLEGAIVTGDALHCNQAMTKAVIEGGGDYVFALKANRSKLFAEANAALDAAQRRRGTVFCESEQETAHGRIERRRAFIVPFAPGPSKTPLAGLVAVARVESSRTVDGRTERQARCFALSLLLSAAEALDITRRHWSIENQLHGRLDVMMREDDTRTRKDNGPANQALLRKLALNVLRADPRKIPMTHKSLFARWNDGGLIELMTHVR